MYELQELEDVIAERQYTVGTDVAVAFTIRLGRPRKVRAGFQCDFAFVGGCESASGWVVGVDAFDALDNAMRMLGSKVNGLNEAVFNNALVWEAASPERPVGLPVVEEDRGY